MIKKYEIINDGSKKRIKALRSFHVQGRYVNIGDVGGIVYDENTLSQEGNGWIFSGNLNYPSIRVSGDSIVDTNGYEADVTDPRPFVNITGTSALIGAHDFVTGSTADGEPIEAYIDINDSRLEFQYTSAMTVATKVNPANTTLVDVYKSVIDTSNLVISKTGNDAFVANIFADVVKCNVRFSAITKNSLFVGKFSNVSELIVDGSYSFVASNATKNRIKVRECHTFAQSATIIPTTALGAAPADMPFTFIRCNVPGGIFYHNPVNRNIYTDIDFGKAITDLSKPLAKADLILVSSERNGMYRVASKSTRALGPLVEDIRSVKNLKLTAVGPNTQGVEIYGDAYLVGAFTIEGNQVYGGSLGHGSSNDIKAKHRVVQGTLNALTVGSTVTGITPSKSAVVTPIRYRINSENGMSVKNVPEGIQVQIVVVDERNVIESVSGAVTTSGNFSNYAKFMYAFINFSKTNYTPITPDELGDTTITVYNGCKIVNTGATAVDMKGNIRVEDNASVYNSAIDGSGYFGGNSVTENANVRGCMYIKDNAVFAPVAEENKTDNLIHLEGNARFIATSRAGLNAIKMSGNSVFSGVKVNSTIDIDLRDNAEFIGSVSGSGTLVMEDNARVEAGALTVAGEVTLCGLYKQTAARNFVGKRIISSEQEPVYDDNVKTEYDF